MGSKMQKRTKKFVSKNLAGAIKKRKIAQKVRQKDEKQRLAKSVREQEKEAAAQKKKADEKKFEDEHKKKKKLADMNIDEFMESGFLREMENDTEDEVDDEVVESEGDDEMEDVAGPDLDDGDDYEDNDTEEESGEEGDDNDDEGEGDLKKSSKKLGGAISQHKNQLESLKEKDPEFFKFLQQNDSDLLNFGEGMDDDGEEDDESDEEGEGDEEQEEEDMEEGDMEENVMEGKPKKKAKRVKVLTEERLADIQTRLKQGATLKGIKDLLHAFRSAAHMADAAEAEDLPYRITSTRVFNKLMLFALHNMDKLFDAFLGRSAELDEDGKVAQFPSKCAKYKKIKLVVKSYLVNMIHVLQELTQPEMLLFVLKQAMRATPYFEGETKAAKSFLKTLLTIWSSADMPVREQAFLCMRTLVLTLPFPFVELALKGTYLTYVRNSRFTSARTHPLISFMANCVVELFGLDFASSYQHAYVYIRQLAVHLRNSMTVKTKEAHGLVYCWQFINSIKLFGKMLGAYSAEGELGSLIYPFVQVVMGTIKLVPSSRYYSLRLHCVRVLVELARESGVYIPVAQLLLEVLTCPDLRKHVKHVKGKPVEIELSIKVTKNVLVSRHYQESCVQGALVLLADHMAVLSWSIAFPEYSYPVILALKKFIKDSKSHRFNKLARTLLEKIEATSLAVSQKRSSVDFSPKDITKLNTFKKEGKKGHTPLSQYVEQLKAEEEKKREALFASGDREGPEIVERSDEEDGEEDDDEDGEDESGEDDGDDGDDVMEEEEKAPKKNTKKNNKPNKPSGPKPKPRAPSADAGEDVVEDFEFSDED